MLCAAVEKLIPVLRSPNGDLQKARAAPVLEVAKQGMDNVKGQVPLGGLHVRATFTDYNSR